jgi:hypothetical protein
VYPSFHGGKGSILFSGRKLQVVTARGIYVLLKHDLTGEEGFNSASNVFSSMSLGRGQDILLLFNARLMYLLTEPTDTFKLAAIWRVLNFDSKCRRRICIIFRIEVPFADIIYHQLNF